MDTSANINLCDEKINEINHSDSAYKQYVDRVAAHAAKMMAVGPVFVAGCSNVWAVFLHNLPEGERRQHYNCSICRRFVEKCGNLVVVDPETGNLLPVVWDKDDNYWLETTGADLSKILHDTVAGQPTTQIKTAAVTNHFMMGAIESGGYAHFYLDSTPMTPRGRWMKDQKYAVKARERFIHMQRTITQNVNTMTETNLLAAINLLETENVRMGNTIINQLKWLRKLVSTYKTTVPLARQKDGDLTIFQWRNLLWRDIMTRPVPHVYFNNTIVGCYLDDVLDGTMSRQTIIKRHRDRTGVKYRMPVAPASDGQADLALAKLIELDLTESVERRHATLDDLQFIWTPPKKSEDIPAVENVDRLTELQRVFEEMKGNHHRNQSTLVADNLQRDVVYKPITWDKFARTVLPEATGICIDRQKMAVCNFGYFTTAKNQDAPPIIRWDHPDRRNPVSFGCWIKPCYVNDFYQDNDPYGRFIPITGICKRPDMWGTAVIQPVLMLCLEGATCSKNIHSSLFPEHLIPELYEVERAIYQYGTQVLLGPAPEGKEPVFFIVGDAHSEDFRFFVKVTTPTGDRYYHIDRCD